LNKSASAPKGVQLSLRATITFASPQITLGALTLALAVHMPRYFASTLGLSLAVVGSSFALVRFVDIPLDPVLGLIMDRTRTRFGRYRVWTLVAVPALMVSLYMLVHAPPGVGQPYLVGWLLLMYVGYSILMLSGLAWAACLATSYTHRSKIFGLYSILGLLGAVAVLVIPIVLRNLGQSDGQGVRAMIWFILASTPVCALLAVARTPEPIARDHSHGQFALRDYWSLLTRGNVLRIVAADLCCAMGPIWLFFAKDSRGFDTTQANLLLLVYIVAGLVGAPFTAWMANRIGKHRALMVNAVAYSLTLLSFSPLPKGIFLVAVPVMFTIGAAGSGLTVVTRAITGDIADEIRLESGREWMGLMFAMTNASTKIASALSVLLTFSLLAELGYDAREGAVNTPRAIHGLEVAFLVGPIVFLMLAAFCFIGYRLSAHRHGEIRRDLEAMDARG
jgi:GPH family glycoside/pentoside/hexuronide:cation symporter